ncbi:hypothetical protein GCM10010361_70020 [Streptomyces olivaceiscleroticus]|uniref:Uncharacterized protein n=1 Tax=Streptomyces olivaceiscleroticus TaxID=68245 RepID=A0ABN1BC65_9ACTN
MRADKDPKAAGAHHSADPPAWRSHQARMRHVRGRVDDWSFANVQVWVGAAEACRYYSTMTCWETPTKIFSQISPKRSPETQEGTDPRCGSGP